ncbi:MAG: rRNA maturation RNase YbeY [Clostridiales bacterium]|jgi:probable rRNA maturation factor|nr:rRNA maturation RNase YbeY [Clostridiales bacterium]
MKNHKADIRSAPPSAGRRLNIPLLRRCVKAALQAEGADIPCEVSVLITDDEGIRALNRTHRKKDEPTDVLSFPMHAMTPGKFNSDPSEINPETGRLPLGDIVLSAERVAAQAEEYGQSTDRETAYLTVHSVLHLLGYDHQDEGKEKRRMRQREEAILQILGLQK